MNVTVLEELILEHEEKLGETNDGRPYRGMFYTIPVFNNPTSISFTPGLCVSYRKDRSAYSIAIIAMDQSYTKR